MDNVERLFRMLCEELGRTPTGEELRLVALLIQPEGCHLGKPA